MSLYLEIINKLLSAGTIFMQVIILVIIINLIFFRNKDNLLLSFVKDRTFFFGFIVSLMALVLSLFYSEIIGFPPCELCWIQRIFLYPQVILFGMELYKREKSIVDFSLVFAVLGALTSIYHIYIENGGTSGILCGAAGSVSCAVRYIYEFGYITMPVMGLTISLFIIVILLNYKYFSRGR